MLKNGERGTLLEHGVTRYKIVLTGDTRSCSDYVKREIGDKIRTGQANLGQL